MLPYILTLYGLRAAELENRVPDGVLQNLASRSGGKSCGSRGSSLVGWRQDLRSMRSR